MGAPACEAVDGFGLRASSTAENFQHFRKSRSRMSASASLLGARAPRRLPRGGDTSASNFLRESRNFLSNFLHATLAVNRLSESKSQMTDFPRYCSNLNFGPHQLNIFKAHIIEKWTSLDLAFPHLFDAKVEMLEEKWHVR